jgi:hypothetical protein
MPEAMHRALEAEAKKKKLKGERFRAYVWGTLAKYKASQKEKKAPEK